MAIAIGLLLALVTAFQIHVAGFDRDRGVYPMLLIFIATEYVLFAVMGGSTHTIIIECIGVVVFSAIAFAGFRTSLWIVVAGLAGHGVYDLLHPQLVTSPAVPAWYPMFCMAYDIGFAACLGFLLLRGGQGKPAAAG